MILWPGDELTRGSGFSAFTGMQGQSHREAEVLGRSKATGLVCRNRKDRGVCRRGGGFSGGISEGHGVPRTKQELKGSRVTEVAGPGQLSTALEASD